MNKGDFLWLSYLQIIQVFKKDIQTSPSYHHQVTNGQNHLNWASFTSEILYLWQHKSKLGWTRNQKLELLVYSICYCFKLLSFHLICVLRFARILLKVCVLILFWPPIHLKNYRNLCQYNMLILWGCATFVSIPVYLH